MKGAIAGDIIGSSFETNPIKEKHFNFLYSYKDEIEKQIGTVLEWKEGRKGCNIKMKLIVENVFDDSTQINQFKWLVNSILIFKKVFTPYIKEYSKEY